MNDDELRHRLAGIDPARYADIEPITSPRARAVLEDIMNIPLIDQPDTGADVADINQPRRAPRAPRWLLGSAAAAVVAIAAIGFAVANGNDDSTEVAVPPTVPATGAPSPTTTPGKLKVLELNGGVDDVMAMCIAISPELVAEAPVAFKGTVTSAENGIVTLTIDQAYKGTDAQVATLVAPEGMEALIGGVAWEIGQQYLITAVDGTVNYCGFSGLATPELQAIFDQAFPT